MAFGWRQETLADSARGISAAGQELYKRLSDFGGHMSKLGQELTIRTRAGLQKDVTADLFPAYDDDGGLLVALTPR